MELSGHKVEEILELLDEYWFFENFFHRRPRIFMSSTDLWNSIQKLEIENENAKKSSIAPTDICEEDGFVHNLLRTPSLPPSIGRDKAVEEKELIRKSSKLTRQASLSSSKAVPQLRDSEVPYYNQHSSDPLYHSSNKIQEKEFIRKLTQQASLSSSKIVPRLCDSEILYYNQHSSDPLYHSSNNIQEKEFIRKSSKLTRQTSLGSFKIVPQLRDSEVLYYNQHSSDPLYHSSNNIQENMVFENKGARVSSTPINSSKESFSGHHNLLRTPSFPSSREETEFFGRSSKLSRQASLCSSDVLPAMNINKVGLQPTIRSPEIPRHRAKKEPKMESLTKNIKNQPNPPPCPSKEVIRRSLSYKKSSSSKTDLEVEEVQGFKDLGFVFDKEEINKKLANIIPGLQEKKQVDHGDDDNEKNKTRRPYLSEAWLVQPSKPVVPNWVDRRSSGDMKEQLKFWARAVASNVRQEC